MSAEKIIGRMRSDAEREMQSIAQEARREADRILAEARLASDEEYARIIREGRRRITAEVSRLHSQAQMDARQTVREAKERCITRCFEEAREELQEIPNTPEYPVILEHLIRDGIEGVGSREVSISARSRDRPLIEELMPRLSAEGFTVHMAPVSVDGLGGVIVGSTDGRVMVNNTFDARLDRKRGSLISAVSRILFGV